MRIVLLVFLLGLSGISVIGQQPKIPVAVFPFAYAQADYRTRASQIHEMVVEILRQRSSIELIDRAKDSFVLKELDNQTREQSMAAPGLVAQGKLNGATQIIVGMVTDVTLEQGSNSGNALNNRNAPAPVYQAIVNFSLQVSDVETGKVINHKTFSNKEPKKGLLGSFSFGNWSTSKEDAIIKGMQACRKSILLWLNEVYPPEIKIEKIEDRDSHGNPKTVLVSGLDPALQRGTTVAIIEVEEFKGDGGKSFTREREIARLKLDEVQGEIIQCKVSSGERVIEEKMKSGAKLQFKVR